MKTLKKMSIMILTVVLLASTIIFAGCTKKSGNVKVIDIPLSQESFVFAAAKNAKGEATIAKVNEWIKNNKSVIDGLMEKYNTKSQEEIAKTTNVEYATKATDKDAEEFVVITSPDYPPYEYEYDHKYYGVDIEIASMMAKELGQKLVIEKSEFDAIIPSVQKADTKVDLAMAGFSWSEDRAKSLSLSDAYVTDSQVIMVNKNNDLFDNAKTAENVVKQIKETFGKKKMKIAAQKGTTAFSKAEELAKLSKRGKALGFTSPALALMDMMNGRVDIVVVDKTVAKLLEKNIKK